MDANKNLDLTDSKQKHNRQTFWQIYFPMLAALGLAVWAAILIFKPESGTGIDARFWADVSAMLLSLPIAMMVLLMILIIAVFSVLFTKAIPPLKNGFARIKRITANLHKIGHTGCGVIQKVFIETESVLSIFARK